VAAAPSAEASPASSRPAATSGVVRSLTGTIVDRDATNLIIEIPGRGSVTVTPGLDTDIRRDGSASSLASLVVGDTATLVLGEDNQLVRILASSTPPAPEPTNSGLTLLWQALLGLLMMGIVLVIDKDLRVKFMASLLEPSGQYRPGKGR